MKITKLLLAGLFASTLFLSCTNDFEEINMDVDNPVIAPIEGVMAGVQFYEFAEPRYLTWRGNLIYTSQFASQFSYNYLGAWFGADCFQNNQGWTNAVFDNSYTKVTLNSRNLLGSYLEIGDTNGAAVTKIMMSWFFQKMTDVYGDVPYSDLIGETAILDNPRPTYDSQKEIYRGILTDLQTQISAIGSSTTTIEGAEGDFVYQGDPQKWKAFANTLRLRIALRGRDAFIADGEQSFIDGVINESLSNTLIDDSNGAYLKRSETSLTLSFLDGGFEDVYHGFGGIGSKFTIAKRYIDMLQDNNDPRLFQIAEPTVNGGLYTGGAIGAKSPLGRDDLSSPSPLIIGTSTTDLGSVVPVKVLSSAESYFLQAEAAVLGFGGNANSLYQRGINASMTYWGVEGSDASNFVNTESIATLSGSNDNMLNMIWNQRWVNSLMNGYESWALARRTDLIPDLTDSDNFWITQPNNGAVPKRLPYSSTEIISNSESVQAAIQVQGADEMNTNIWWDIN
jgi:hypothetical protein